MRKVSVLKSISGVMILFALISCNRTSIEGVWVEPIPGMGNMVQGISLEKGGVALSVNMESLQYETWEKCGDFLILSGKSIGNHQTLSFSDTLIIEDLTPNKLTLKRDNLTLNYQRQK